MSVAVAYLTVILVWTTTPLGITWSNETLPPSIAAMSRMIVAASLGWCILRAMGRRVSWRQQAIRKYLTADIGIFGGMYLTYLAAESVPSGLISVIYGLSPLISAILAQYLLREDAMSLEKWGAGVLAVVGLGYIFGEAIELNRSSLLGVLALFVAVFLFSLSGVLLKKSEYRNDPFEQTVGTLICAVPMYLMVVLFESIFINSDNNLLRLSEIANTVSITTVMSVLYLAVIGSLLGFICYFYILTRLSPSQVALTTLVTPVLALILGMTLNDEQITLQIGCGVAAILLALTLFNWDGKIRRIAYCIMQVKLSKLFKSTSN